jgi:GNAT superfamily N-acetyltransferase
MIISQARIEDIPQIAPLFDAYRVFYKKPCDIEGANKFLEDHVINKTSVIFFSKNDKGIVTAFVQLYPIFTSTGMNKSWLLNDLFVKPEHRGKGISKNLIEKCKELCRDTKASGLMLETEKTNNIGNKLYTSTGFGLIEHNFYWWNNS